MKNIDTAFKSIWAAIKRNPVINATLIAILTQFLQDAQSNKVDWSHFVGYLSMLAFAAMAREFTVPAKENEALRKLNREMLKGVNKIDN